VLLVALTFGVSSTAFASVVHLPPGTAVSGAIPIGTGTGQAPPDQWSFVPFSDTSCSDPGTTAAIDFYPSSTSNKDRLLIYFLGRGGCDDYNSCFNMRFGQMAPGFIGIVPRLAGLTTDSPPTDVTVLGNDNAADGNHFTDWSKVFVQYCTGDYHMGNNVATYKDLNGGSHIIQHVGFAKVQKYLGRLTTTFCSGAGCTMPPPRQIVVAGSSDGGYGAVWNFEQIRNRFRIADSNIQLIDDSGPYMRMPYWTQTLQTQMATNWFGTGVGAIFACMCQCGFQL
jgi:hypothetical protein